MTTTNSLLNYYDASFSDAANAYGQRLESLSRTEKAQLIQVIGDWVALCCDLEESDYPSFYEHIGVTGPFDTYDCAALQMVEKYLDFVEPRPALQLAIALSWQILEGVYAAEEEEEEEEVDDSVLEALVGDDF